MFYKYDKCDCFLCGCDFQTSAFVFRISPAVNMAAVRRRSLKSQKRRQQFARTCSYVQGCSQFIKS